MPSPFPGMDPWLEDPAVWPDLHGGLLYELRKQLTALLPEPYVALVDQHVWLETDLDESRHLMGKPDIAISSTDNGNTVAAESADNAAPLLATLPMPTRNGHRYLKIVDRQHRRIVTAIELLSPANKQPHKNRANYLEKRSEYFESGINLVEIDLLRSGARMPMGEQLPSEMHYCVMVARGEQLPQAEVWPIGVRDNLPKVNVPLDSGRHGVSIDLKSALDICYDNARYDKVIDYTQPPAPPLNGPDRDWADRLITNWREQ